jgi:hypothetical protein
MRHALILVVVAGCGRLGFDARADGGDDDTVDADPTCWPAWRTQTVQLSTPQSIDLGFGRAFAPYLSADGLSLYASVRIGVGMSAEFIVSHRVTQTSAWGTAVQLTEFVTSSEEEGLTMSPDELTIIFSSSRPGGSGDNDFYTATRTTKAGTFGAQTRTGLLNLETPIYEFAPHLRGSRLYYAPSDDVTQHIVVAERATSGTNLFFDSTPVPGLPDGVLVADPGLSPDETVILFAYGAVADVMLVDLAYAVRADRNAAFGGFELLPGNVLDPQRDQQLTIREDGCELIYYSDRLPQGLWVTTVVR